MEKQQLTTQLTELKAEHDKVKASEKKAKSELQEEKLKHSKILQDAMAVGRASGPQTS